MDAQIVLADVVKFEVDTQVLLFYRTSGRDIERHLFQETGTTQARYISTRIFRILFERKS